MEEDCPSIPMEKAGKILRKSIHTFLQHYQFFTTTAAVLALPFAASVLLSEAIVPSSSLLPTIHNRLQSLFYAAGFPSSSQFFTILSLKLSQSITSSILVLPFTLSFLLIAKASVIQYLNHSHHKNQNPYLGFSYLTSLCINPLFLTQLWNSFVVLSANATSFSVMLIAFNCLDRLYLSSPTSILFISATGAVIYSIILANALIICNLALVLAGTEKSGGYIAILKACVMIRGRAATALSLALPVNLCLAAVEALFQYRIVRAFSQVKNPNSSMALEGLFIAYLYSIFIVLDTIVGCIFYKSCKSSYQIEEARYCYSYRIKIEEEDGKVFANVKSLEELP